MPAAQENTDDDSDCTQLSEAKNDPKQATPVYHNPGSQHTSESNDDWVDFWLSLSNGSTGNNGSAEAEPLPSSPGSTADDSNDNFDDSNTVDEGVSRARIAIARRPT